MLETEGKEAPAAESNQAQVTAGHVSTNTLQGPGGASVSPPVASIHSHSPAPPATEDEDESEDESDILEESPCGRWQKRREEVRGEQEAELSQDQLKMKDRLAYVQEVVLRHVTLSVSVTAQFDS